MGDTLGDLWERELAASHATADRKERCLHLHGYGCARAECGRATSADLLELDAVSEPVDGDSPAAVHQARGQEAFRAWQEWFRENGVRSQEELDANRAALAEAMCGGDELLPTSDPGRSIAPMNPQHQDEEHGG